jgi:glycosyltransferase involved in cell wall biosynthesis
MEILFWDVTCNKSYTIETEKTEALGGTERAVLRVASELVRRGHDISIYQHTDAERVKEEVIGGIRHVGIDTMFPTPDVVVHLRTTHMVPLMRDAFPAARHIVWAHDLTSPETIVHEDFAGVSAIVAVSEFHRTNIEASARYAGVKIPTVVSVYNIVAPIYANEGRIPGHAVFLSSPHKGLEQCVQVFQEARKAGSLNALHVLNPGYRTIDLKEQEGIFVLDECAHDRAMEELSKAAVLLYPQNVFPETFGYIYAEAVQLGIPILGYDFGAAREIVPSSNPLFRHRDVQSWVNSLADVLALKLEPGIDARFSNDTIGDKWETLLEEVFNDNKKK